MKNLGDLMKQAQAMQERVAEMQEKLADVEITGTAGGGMVTVTLNGRGEARKTTIDPALFEGREAEVIEDLVVAAINDAKAKVEAHVQEEMRQLTGGLDLPPGFKLPI